MASSPSAPPPASPPRGPPPPPTSLLGLPQAWLLQLVTCPALDGQRNELMALYRTCTFSRDEVLRLRTAVVEFRALYEAQRFPAEVERLCTIIKRSSRVQLEFGAPWWLEDDEDDEEDAATPILVDQEETFLAYRSEWHISHLLVCAAAQLEGRRPLARVRGVVLRVSRVGERGREARGRRREARALTAPCFALPRAIAQHEEQMLLPPAWIKVLCPNVAALDPLAGATVPPPVPPPHQPRHGRTPAPSSSSSGPPATPTSLLGLPGAWLMRLVTCPALTPSSSSLALRTISFPWQWMDWQPDSDALAPLFRTCTFLRDEVLRLRTAVASFQTPGSAQHFTADVERLCAVARRSSRVRVRFWNWTHDYDNEPMHTWTESEPYITHLLVCAAAQLGGKQPLACVKEMDLHVSQANAAALLPACISWSLPRPWQRHHSASLMASHLQGLWIAAPVPAWAKVLCPHATLLRITNSPFTEPLLHQARPHPHLRHLECETLIRWLTHPAGLAEHVRQQLATLPRLTSLTVWDWADQCSYVDGQPVRRLFSTTLTRLEFWSEDNDHDEGLQGLSTRFPCLREFCAPHSIILDDDGLAALLRLPHLERVHVRGVDLEQQHHHAPHGWTWRELGVQQLDVASFARLPLDSIQAGRLLRNGTVEPSSDAASVARVAQAIQRWGGLSLDGRRDFIISAADLEALLMTLGPLVAALPAAQQQRLTIRDLRHATPPQVQHLGLQLPAGVTTLSLDWRYGEPPAALWGVLLPSLPPTVEELRLGCRLAFTEVMALCQAAHPGGGARWQMGRRHRGGPAAPPRRAAGPRAGGAPGDVGPDVEGVCGVGAGILICLPCRNVGGLHGM